MSRVAIPKNSWPALPATIGAATNVRPANTRGTEAAEILAGSIRSADRWWAAKLAAPRVSDVPVMVGFVLHSTPPKLDDVERSRPELELRAWHFC